MPSTRSTIFTLPSTGGGSSDGADAEQYGLRGEIEAGLLGTEEPTVPGEQEEDKAWSFKRSVPTMVLYDEQGLRLYDQITAKAPEYYLFNDELNLLRTHGADIARSMGFLGRKPLTPEEQEEEAEQGKEERKKLEEELRQERRPAQPWKPARWGDSAVGKWNNGVNGEQGMGGGFERGYDVVELGAGALRKTAHLLTALAASLPENNDTGKIPITYHPLDLSYPELDRVLGEMDEAYGDKLSGKVECIGLHGDYNAGLDFIKAGKLAALRASSSSSSKKRDYSPDSAGPVTPPHANIEIGSPTSTADTQLDTPRSTAYSLPSNFDGKANSTGSANGSQEDYTRPESPVSIHIDEPAQESEGTGRPLHIVFLGSSLGNFPREAAGPFLKSLPLHEGDTLLLGLDGRPAPGEEGKRKVEVAYNDPAGYTRAFEEHGWKIVQRELGLEADAGVEFVGRYNEVLGRHEAYFKSKANQTIKLPTSGKEVNLEEGELLNIEWSYKYSHGEALSLFEESNLRIINSWKAPDSEYRLWLLERPKLHITPSPVNLASTPSTPATALEVPDERQTALIKGLPKWSDWQEMWAIWDHITLGMIPEPMLHTKPIDLRHICLFYIGHIPTFLDIYLTRLTNGEPTHPAFFKDIFERGIDPDVDDPTKIHDHSEVPVEEADWPVLRDILAFRDRVRERVRDVYQALNNGSMPLNRRAARTLFMTYEHEAMHAETLLYMLIQSSSTRAPHCLATPQWDILAKRWSSEEFLNLNEVISIPAGSVDLGHDDIEDDDDKFVDSANFESHDFGWDLENPRISVEVKAFKIDALPISNAEYLHFAKQTNLSLTKDSAPASWLEVNGEWRVRTLYGPVGFEVACRWPLQASKNELEAYATWKGGRLPTEPELRAFWAGEDGARPSGPRANTGFQNWHPIPAEKTRVDNAGIKLHGHNGGVWEWTSSEFKPFEGYTSSKLYPGYSSDFFDGKHFVVLGGSYATISQIADRKSFRNWYQGNYRFSFVGGRVAYD